MGVAVERRCCEIRADGDGRGISGVAIRYGDVARIGAVRERFAPGAFAPLPADLLLTVQHDRAAPIARLGAGLSLSDDGAALRFEAALPETPRADAALADVRAGLLAGASVEFRALRVRNAAGERVIERAALVGLSLVDTPAYPAASIAARQGDGDPRPLVPEEWVL